MTLSRRDLLKYASLAAVGAAGVTTATLGGAVSGATAPVRWAGHKPGRIYLGVANADDLANTLRLTGPVGLTRTFYKWSDGSREDRNISSDHAAGRMPWISFKPASTGSGGWASIASGKYDSDIRARARRYAAHSKPIIVTFNHEPHNDHTGSPADFARAWTRIHDVMKNETNLKNVVSVPIIGEWEFNPVNRTGNPQDFITGAVLDRCHFLGLDLYQTQKGEGYAERLGRVLNWLDGKGHSTKMVGLGETAASNDFGSPNGADWWAKSWAWAASNAGRVGAISYFSSLKNNNSGMDWRLNESAAKLAAFKKSLASSTATKL